MAKMTMEEYAREMAAFENTAPHRYAKAFPDNPIPLTYWYEPLGELWVLMDEAVARGVPLTAEDLMAAQGLEMPRGAIV
jgi:hypothetical protein